MLVQDQVLAQPDGITVAHGEREVVLVVDHRVVRLRPVVIVLDGLVVARARLGKRLVDVQHQFFEGRRLLERVLKRGAADVVAAVREGTRAAGMKITRARVYIVADSVQWVELLL